MTALPSTWRAQRGERFRRPAQGIDLLGGGFDFPLRRPLERGQNVLSISPVAAHQFLLFDKERPQWQPHLAPGRRAASDDRPAASQAGETLREHLAADVFDDQIDAAAAGELAHGGGPIRIGSVDDMLRAQGQSEATPGVGRAGGDDAGAELEGDLNGGRADAAGAAHCQHPIAGLDGGAVGEHVHGRARGQGQGGGRGKIHLLGQAHEGGRGHGDLLGKSAVALHAKELAVEAGGFLTARAKLALAAKEIGLHGDAVARAPIGHVRAQSEDMAGDFPARHAGQGEGHGQSTFLQPQIQPVEAAGANADDDFAGSGSRVGEVGAGKFSRRAVSDELDGFHWLGLITTGGAGSPEEYVTRRGFIAL